MISVLMSTFNESNRELHESIDSVLAQDYSDFEFIIVVDNPENKMIIDTLKEYKKYCFEMFGLRFKKYKHLLVPTDTYVSVEDMRKILKGKGFTVETMDDDSSSTTAHVVGEKMIVNLANKLNKGGKVSTQTFVHEMAHIFENKFKLDQKTKHCHEMANSSSNYILNPAETFSEHFANYFLQPKYLKAGWKEVYEELTKIIPKEWRDLISSIIRASK